MVARVYGLCCGTQIELCQEEGFWRCELPFCADGEYYLALFAEDEAGNRTFLTRVLYAVCAGELCGQQEDPRYVLQNQTEIYQLEGYCGNTFILQGGKTKGTA